MIQAQDIERLQRAAERALSHAYAPYSRFAVGASVMTVAGDIFAGCNVENAAFPAGLCAEAAAIAAMVTAVGASPIRAVFVAVAAPERAWPCGSCRQRLQEFSEEGAVVYAAGAGGAWMSAPFAELLPLSFGAKNFTALG